MRLIKVTYYKMDIQNSLHLYISNKDLEIVIKMPFTIVMKTIKYLGLSITKNCKT